MKRFVLAVIVTGACAVACGHSEETTSQESAAVKDLAEVVGTACNSDSACEGLSGAFCPNSFAVCTRKCSYHADCGCAAGTTTGDIRQGKCKASCVGFSESQDYCLRVCANNSDCFGTTKCTGNNGYSVCL
jgi:hypothetical protein